MKISTLLDSKVQEFIESSLFLDPKHLAFKKNPFENIEWSEIVNQIVQKKKSKEKLPTWYNAKNIIYPSKISIEQTSSEKAAIYKSNLISGKKIIDLTGGFGIDSYFFSKKFESTIHCEINNYLSEIVAHNYSILNANSIQCVNGDGLEILSNANTFFDWIYIDPSRRSENNSKVFILSDCLPNIPQLIDKYLFYTNNILIKTAPLLDITSGINELKFVKEIHIVSIKNEIKELLWIIEKKYTNSISIVSTSIEENAIEQFKTIYKQNYLTAYSLPKKYLYEPNSSIMKSGNVDALCEKYSIEKLHTNSHLFTSDEIIDFPGRRFKINESIPFQKEQFKKITNQKMNCTTRNFPLKIDEIKKKFKIKDGGSVFTFFTTNVNNEKIVLLCTKFNQNE